MDLITFANDFDATKLSYGGVRVNSRGGKSIKILDERKNTLVLSTPLILTYGVQKNVDEDSGRVNYSMALQFPSDEYANDDMRNLREQLAALEQKILDDAVVNSKEWFNKAKQGREVAEALFYPILKFPKNKDSGETDHTRSPTLKVKIPYWEGKFNVELYDTNEEPIYLPSHTTDEDSFPNFVPKMSHVMAAVQCNGIWFAGGRFGVTWQLVQAIVRRPVRIAGGCHLRLSDSDRKAVASINAKEQEQGEDDHDDSAPAQVIDSDSEDEDDTPAPEPEPAPKKKVVKKKVIKKKSA
jgi:hypothetical protein